MATSDKQLGKYLYCIIRSPEPVALQSKGIGGQDAPVTTIHHRNLACVVSDSPVVEYDNSRRHMMAHTLVLEEVMRAYTILPVRFGTVAPSAESVHDRLLVGRHDELNRMLLEMEDQREMGLKAFWFEEAIFAEILDENPAIRKLRDGLIGKRPEETYFERIRLGEMIGKAMDTKRDLDSERILTRLRPMVHKTVLNKTIADRMVLNAAFLVNRQHEAGFDGAIQALDAEMGKRVMFKYVGPVPPYNFVNIVFHVN